VQNQTHFQRISYRLKAYINIVFAGVIFVLIISLIGNIASTRGSIKTVEKKEREVAALAQEREELRKKLERVQSGEFIEKLRIAENAEKLQSGQTE